MCRSSFTCFFFGTADIFTGRSSVNLVGRNLPLPHGASILAHFARSRIDLAGDLRKGWNRSDYILQQKKEIPQNRCLFVRYLSIEYKYTYYLDIYIYHINIIIRLTGLWCIYLSRRTRNIFLQGYESTQNESQKTSLQFMMNLPILFNILLHHPIVFWTTVQVFFLNSRSEHSRLSEGGYLIEVHPLPWFELSVNLYLMLW